MPLYVSIAKFFYHALLKVLLNVALSERRFRADLKHVYPSGSPAWELKISRRYQCNAIR